MEGLKKASEVTTNDVRERYKKFLEDDTNLKKIEAHGYGWLTQGFIVELFVPDFSDLALVKVKDPDFYKRYTGIAKILSASPLNEGPRADLKAGDIVFCGDDLHSMTRNYKHTEWLHAQPNQIKDKVIPIEFIRKVHRWIEGGLLMLPNRGESVASKRGLEVSLETIGQIDEPMVFRLLPMDILFKITGDPWA